METLIIILVTLTTIAIPALTEAAAAASQSLAGTFAEGWQQSGKVAAEMTQKKSC